MKRPDFPDVNVLVALSAEGHPLHSRASAYFRDESSESIVLSWVQLMGLARTLSRPFLVGQNCLSVPEAWQVCQNWRNHHMVDLVTEPSMLQVVLNDWVKGGHVSAKLWTDAFLAAWAVAEGHRLVTFDRDFLSFPGLDVHLLAP